MQNFILLNIFKMKFWPNSLIWKNIFYSLPMTIIFSLNVYFIIYIEYQISRFPFDGFFWRKTSYLNKFVVWLLHDRVFRFGWFLEKLFFLYTKFLLLTNYWCKNKKSGVICCNGSTWAARPNDRFNIPVRSLVEIF